MAIDTSGARFDITNGLATDTASINGLKNAARKDPNSPEAIKGAAKQFEAMFLNMVMKSMRDASPQNGPFDSEQTKTFTAMLDQQMSQTLAQRGIGLADVLARQLSVNRGQQQPQIDPAQNIDADQEAKSKSVDSSKLLPFGMDRAAGSASATRHLHENVPAHAIPLNRQLMNADNNSKGKRRVTSPRPPHVEAFHNKVSSAADEASQTTGIPAKFMMAQAALESGWGKHVIQNKDGSSSNNLFGIKATAGWKGKVVEAATSEYVNGVATRKLEKFRAYDSYADSFRDYASMLRHNPRYEKVIANAQDMNGFAQGLQRAGYATDPRYAEKLTSIIRQS